LESPKNLTGVREHTSGTFHAFIEYIFADYQNRPMAGLFIVPDRVQISPYDIAP